MVVSVGVAVAVVAGYNSNYYPYRCCQVLVGDNVVAVLGNNNNHCYYYSVVGVVAATVAVDDIDNL